MKAVLYIAQRYLFSKSKRNVINLISWITLMVMVVGGASLFIVMSAFSGLKEYGLSLSSVFDPDLKVLPVQGKYLMLDSLTLNKIRRLQGVEAVSCEVEERVFLSYDKRSSIAQIKGVDVHYTEVNPIDETLIQGEWKLGDHQVVMGVSTWLALGVSVYDYETPLRMVVPKPGKGSILSESKPYRERVKVVSGIYQISEDLNRKYVFTSLAEAQDLLGLKPYEISGLELKISPLQEQSIRKELLRLLKDKVKIKNRQQLNDAFYRMLNTENVATYLIFTLVLVVALFNLAGALLMVIVDKREHLRVLYSMGFSVGQLKQIFFMQGAMMSVVGAVLGLFIGAVIIGVQQYWGWLMITEEMPYPVVLDYKNMIIVGATIVFLGAVASWIASRRVSKKLLSR